MSRPPLAVVETPAFLRSARAIRSDEDIDALIFFLAHTSDAGDLIPETGGLRKLRWSAGARGRRGVARVVYYHFNEDAPLFLIAAYAKARQGDLTPDQKRAGRAFVEEVKARCKRRD